ncbi:MAG: hypothetical protein LBJ46_03085 [Planctomycetota bacterium]|nr:hypothetical protein [Planctomycetota bacterium]
MIKLITMLTHNDVTVKEAKEVFLGCADLPCEFWGFKDVGLPKDEMRDLASLMRDKGKTTFLEVVTLSEEGGLEGARLAIDCGFDYLLGTLYFDSVMKLFAGAKTRYLPFIGKVRGHPSILEGTPGEIAADGLRVQKAGAHGVDILAYRNREKPAEIVAELVKTLDIPVCVAGSIDDFSRIDEVKRLDPWSFTIGGAFFEKRFRPNGDFRGQIAAVLEHIGE